MTRFYGKFDYSVDSKGRVNIPAKFRKSLSQEAAETFIICRSPGGCLRIYPQDSWNVYEEELLSRPQTPEVLEHRRLLFNSITDSTLDAQGRVSLSPEQMAIAGIKKNVTMSGQGDYIELWDTQIYNDRYNVQRPDFDAVFFSSVKVQGPTSVR